VRTFHHMERGLEGEIANAAPPAGVELRPYRHPADSSAVFDALEECFRDHWASEPYPREVHDDEMARADPDVTPVAVDGDEIVGVCVSRVLEDAAWVDVLGVRAPWRRRGVARALLLRSFHGLAARGAPHVVLNVDSESPTGATRLYESVGMRVRRAWEIFETPVDTRIS
jgi:mycothiol synthase